jgi:hypothetical protein
MEVDTGLDEMVLTFASVEGPRGGGTMEVVRQATQPNDTPRARAPARGYFRAVRGSSFGSL